MTGGPMTEGPDRRSDMTGDPDRVTFRGSPGKDLTSIYHFRTPSGASILRWPFIVGLLNA
jgi:hypothetical protein